MQLRTSWSRCDLNAAEDHPPPAHLSLYGPCNVFQGHLGGASDVPDHGRVGIKVLITPTIELTAPTDLPLSYCCILFFVIGIEYFTRFLKIEKIIV